METQPRKIQQTIARPLTHFTRAPQTQTLQISNSDQQIQPPLMIDDQKPKDSNPLITKDINNLDHSSIENVIVFVPLN